MYPVECSYTEIGRLGYKDPGNRNERVSMYELGVHLKMLIANDHYEATGTCSIYSHFISSLQRRYASAYNLLFKG